MRTAERYDVVCVGGTFSAYLSAALLSLAGCKVLLVDEQESGKAHDVDGRTIFDPDLSVLWGLEFESPLSRLLGKLGVLGGGNGVERPYVSCSGFSQVLHPHHRLHLSYEKEKVIQELSRELPEHEAALKSIFDLLLRSGQEIPRFSSHVETVAQMPSGDLARALRFWGPLGRAALGKNLVAVAESFNDPSGAVSGFLSGLLATLVPVSPKHVGTEQLLRSLCVAARGQAFWRGGSDALKKTLLNIVLQKGSDFVSGARVQALMEGGASSRSIRGVLLSSYDGAVFSSHTILSTHLREIYQALPKSSANPGVLRNLGRVTPSHWRYTLAVSLNRDVIPIGATELMTYIGSYKLELEEENLLRIVILPEKVYDESDSADTVTVQVTALVPYRASSLNYAYLRRLGGKMLHALAEIIPFFEYNVVSMYPDIRKGDRDLKALYPFDKPQWVPENLLTYHVRGGHEVQDFWGTAWATPHENLYFAGRTALPSMGLYGEALIVEKIVNDLLFPFQREKSVATASMSAPEART